MPPPVLTLRYLTRFECIADRCEDTCCSGMQILVSDANRQTLAEALGEGEAGRAELAQKLVPLPDAPYGYRWALARDERGTCRSLDARRLCSLVTRFGPGVLSDSCALFPRVQHVVDGAVEMVASLACPEAARLCLLADDAVERVEAPGALAAQVRPASLPLAAAGGDVRAWGLSVLEDGERSAAHRLLSLWAGDVHVEPSSPPLPAEPVIGALLSLLTGLQRRGTGRLNALIDAVLPTYQVAALELEPALGQPEGPRLETVLWQVFVQKKARVERTLGFVLEPALTRYWVNDWYREPFTRAPSLQVHAFRMILRAAVLRFLLIGHPAVELLAAHHEGSAAASLPSDHRALLERALVETVQIYAKHIERDRELLELVDAHLTPQSLGTDAWGRARMFAQAV